MEILRKIWMAKHAILIAAILVINLTKVAGLLILSSGSEAGRSLTQSGVTSEDQTVRIDPLNNLKKYRGGYDVTNKHYWSSTVFTGVYGYAIAVFWLLFGLGFGLFLLITKCCCKSSRKRRKTSFLHNHCHLQPLLLAIFFTLLAINQPKEVKHPGDIDVAECDLSTWQILIGKPDVSPPTDSLWTKASKMEVIGPFSVCESQKDCGNSKFHSRAKTVIDVIIDAAEEASITIYNTTGAMKNMSTSLREVDGSSKATEFLNSTSQKLDTQAADIETNASKDKGLIYKGVNIVYLVTTMVIVLTLVIAVSLLALGVLKFQRSLQVLVAFCWIFIIICWLFFGIYFFLQNLAGDTCRALEGFQQDPYNNSLSSILPCEELLSAKATLHNVSAGIHDLVIKASCSVNQIIELLCKSNYQTDKVLYTPSAPCNSSAFQPVNDYIFTSYGNIAQICNPFSSPPVYEYQPWNCPATSVRIGDIPKLLSMLACPDSVHTCTGGILVPANYYKKIEAYCTSIQTLLDAYPGMESLVECQTVKNAFSIILHKHCKPLKRYIRMIWIPLVCLSAVLVVLVLIWTFEHHCSGESVNSRDYGTIECGATMQTNDHTEHSPEV